MPGVEGSRRIYGQPFPVAVVGIGCRMPGDINSPEDYWKAVLERRDVIREIPPDRWSLDFYHDSDQTKVGKMVSRKAGTIDGIDMFDNSFFKISPREACSMDPQQRHLLEVTNEAFEDAAIDPETLKEKAGVFIGIGLMDYPIEVVEPFLTNAYTLTGMAHSVAANRLSYVFDLRGPSYAVDTACASSMHSMYLGCTALWNGDCKVAVAGGCNAIIIPETSIGFSSLGVTSPVGQCCPFSDTAQGYVRSEGWGVMILKPLEDALRDNDKIYSVMRGGAVAANGFCQSLTMPSQEGQELVMRMAYEQCGVPTNSIQYVEAHGTGTPVGDPIEAEAIGHVFRDTRKVPLRIGSIKGNLGHNECAAGVTAAIKVCLMLNNKKLVPSINYRNPNPALDLEELNLEVQQEIEDFEPGVLHRFGLNSFGFAGAVAHMIFEEAPKIERKPPTHTSGWQLGDNSIIGEDIVIPLSAKSNDALKATCANWADFESELDAYSIVGWQMRRRQYENRMAVIANSGQNFREVLESFISGGGTDRIVSDTLPLTKSKVCMIFPGQGQQWFHMGRRLYATESVFRDAVNHCDELYKRLSGKSLLEEFGLFNGGGTGEFAESVVNDIEVSQPAILFLEVAVFHLWLSWGVKPDVIVGHSLGDVGAAYACGGLSLEEAITVIYYRAIHQSKLKGTGSMAALRGKRQVAEKLIAENEDLYMAAINAPESVTLAGKEEVIKRIADENPTNARQLRVQCAFHTPDMDPIKEGLRKDMEGKVKTGAGVRTTPFYSTVTGELYEGDFGFEYWWKNIRNPVLFQPAIESILKDTEATVFLECASSATLLSSVNQIIQGVGDKRKLFTVPSGQRNKDDRISMLRALGSLYCSGVDIDWNAITYHNAQYAPLPKYPWQHQSFWIEGDERKKRRLGEEDRSFIGQNGVITLEMFDFLGDHHAGEDKLVFPGAGYVEFMIQAFFKKDENPSLRNINFVRGLFWPEQSIDGGALKINMRAEKNGSKVQVMTDEVHCEAEVQAPRPADEPLGVLNVEEILKRCPNAVEPEPFYEYMYGVGLNYGPAFRKIEEARVGDGEGLFYLKPANDRHQRANVTILDGSFQLAFATCGYITTLHLPIKIDSVEMSMPSTPLNESLVAYCKITDSDSLSVTADIVVAKRDGTILIDMKGWVAQSITGNKTEVDINTCLYSTKFETHRSCLPPTSLAAEMFEEKLLRESYPEELDAADRFQEVGETTKIACASYMYHALKEAGTDCQNRNQRWISRLQNIVNKERSKLVPRDQIDDLLVKVEEKVPEMKHELFMVKTLGDALVKSMKDPNVGIQLLFAPGCLDQYFNDSLTTRVYYRRVSDYIVRCVKEVLKHKSVARIIEVGGRQGGLAKFIVDPLKELCEEGKVKYLFTDLAATWFPMAQQKLSDYPFIVYQTLDIEKNIEEQDFVPGSFDIVLCMDTLHATYEVDPGAVAMRDLLCEDGQLIMFEATNTYYISELVFGVLELCWVYTDFRQESCWLDQKGWADVLINNGFSDVITLSSHHEFFHSVFVARRGQMISENKDEKNWLLVSSKAKDLTSKLQSALPGKTAAGLFDKIGKEDWLKPYIGSQVDTVFFWDIKDQNLHRLIKFIQMAAENAEIVSSVWVVTEGGNEDIKNPSAALPVGLVRSVVNQIPKPNVFSVDLAMKSTTDSKVADLVSLLTDAIKPEREIAVRNGDRRIPRIIRETVPETPCEVSSSWRVEQLMKKGKATTLDDLSFCSLSEMPLSPGEVRVEVKAVALNFKDVMMAMGMLEGLEQDGKHKFGLECSGIVAEVGTDVTNVRVGDEVVAMGSHCMASHAVCDSSFVARKPSNLDWVEAASVCIVFVTAYHCLVERAGLRKGETVLIHSACGGVGLAAIQIANQIGATVMCTAGTEEKREYLRDTMNVQHVSDSRSEKFYNDVMKWTGGQGVDVVLNSLYGNLLMKSLASLSIGGRFCEIGKRDMLENNQMQMSGFLENKSFLSCQIDLMMKRNPERIRSTLNEVMNLFGKNSFQPIPITKKPVSEIVDSFRTFSKGLHIGKYVFEVESNFEPSVVKRVSDKFTPDGTYLLTGGFGGIGLSLARWLCDNANVKHLAIVSRRGCRTALARRTVDYIRGQGVTVYEFSADLSQEKEVKSMLGNIQECAPPLKGIFHLAGVMDEEDLLSLEPNQIDRMINAKATSARHLHNLTMDKQLDIFFLLSSVTATWGNGAQPCYVASNLYLDALAEYRRSMGLAALSIQLSAVRGAGFLEENKEACDILASKGMMTLYVDEFLDMLGLLLQTSPRASVCFSNQNWNATQQFCNKSVMSFHHLVDENSAGQGSCDLSEEELEERIKQKLSKLLALAPERIDIDQPMINFGVDSMMAVDLVTWANKDLGIIISQLDILSGITTKALLEQVLDKN